MAKFIEMRGKLGIGHYAIVDDEDYEYLSQFKWHFNGYGYATRAAPGSVLMHREILGVSKDIKVDHINHDKLDNRHSNLRIATSAENARNQKRRAVGPSGYKGVSRNGPWGWRASIMVDYKFIGLGTFDQPEEAARAYDEAALYYFGEFACLNFAQEGQVVESE